jgi:hypothetical protein
MVLRSPPRLEKECSSLTKRDGSLVKSILKLRRSQSLKKVSFGHDEVIYTYSEVVEVRKQYLARALTLPDLMMWSKTKEANENASNANPVPIDNEIAQRPPTVDNQ